MKSKGLIGLCILCLLSKLSFGLTSSVFLGEQQGGFFGKSISFGGDVLGNGQKTLWIGAPQVPSGNKGKVYRYTASTLSTTTTNASSLPSISETSITFQFGKYILSNVDLDNDRKSDTLFGVPDDDKTLIFLGSRASSWGNNIRPSSTNVTIQSASVLSQLLDKNGEYPGFLSAMGDLNGDGYKDLAIGALGTSNVYIVYGKSSWPSTIDLDSASSPNIQTIFTKSGSEKIGYNVAIIPDINGDGLDELAISTYQPSAETGKQVYLFYGKKDKFASLKTSGITVDISKADAVFQSGSSGTDGFGEQILGLGDCDGDGYGDFAITAPAADSKKGAIYIYYGGPGKPYSGNVAVSSISIKGETANARLGYHALDSGDFNGDGKQDLAIGEYLGNSLKGTAYVFYSGSSRFSGQTLSSQADWKVTGNAINDNLGYAVKNAGDWESDGKDELAIGIPGFSTNTGLVKVYANSTSASANLSSGSPSLTFYSDSALSKPITSVTTNQIVYLKLVATDPQSGTVNCAFITASSNRIAIPITLKLVETGSGTGVFTGYVRPVSTRSNPYINQVGVSVNGTVLFKGASILGSLTMANTVPSLNGVTATQISTGNSGLVQINYTAIDAEEDLGSFTQTSGQVQFLGTGNIWENATITGNTQSVGTLAMGKAHSSAYQPLYWKAGADNFANGTTQIRLKLYDGTGYSRIITSNTFTVSNTAPSVPVFFSIPTKNSFSISVSGNADSGTTVKIYVSATNGTSKLLAATVTANNSGVFNASSIAVTSTRNRLTATSQTSLGLVSAESSAVLVAFSIVSQSFTDGLLSAQIVASMNALPNDKALEFAKVATSSLTAAPSFYHFVQAFSVALHGQSSTTLNTPVSITITLPTALSSTRNIAVRYLDTGSNTWKSTGISLKRASATQITFTTTHFTQFAILDTTDIADPVINTPKINGEFVVSDKFYSSTPVITVTIKDTESGIATWSIQLKNTTTAVTATQNTGNGNGSTQNITITLRQNTALAEGSYAILITAQDRSIHTATSYTVFSVGNSSFIFDCIAGPNPYNPDRGALTIGYNLSQDADSVMFYIVNPRGDLLWSYTATTSEKTVGYHTLSWDGKFGSQALANGPYFLFSVAKKGSTTKKSTFRLGVLR